jgi:formate-dependent nitrite reductase membrane component NrfD
MKGEQLVVPKAEFRSYYGLPIIKEPVWRVPEVPGYLFLGGLAGASSALAAGADLSGRAELARTAKTAAAAAISVSAVALVADLGRPARFHHMLRVFKPSSPMSVGSWLLSGYGPAAAVAAACALTGRLPTVGRAATVAAAVTGPGIAAYTAALLSDTAVPAWHDAHRELPYLFVSSAATAAGGLGLLLVNPAQAAPARNLAIAGAAAELTAKSLLLRRLGPTAEPYQSGRAGRLMEAAELLTAGGLTAAALGGRNRPASALAGAALLTASALTRFGVFYAGRTSARDPKYIIQRHLFRTGCGASLPEIILVRPANEGQCWSKRRPASHRPGEVRPDAGGRPPRTYPDRRERASRKFRALPGRRPGLLSGVPGPAGCCRRWSARWRG